MKNFLYALLCLLCSGPGPSFLPEREILYLSGASSLSDLSEDELDRYQRLVDHPLDLNRASEFRLRESGLLSDQQISALMRERRSSGDILSYAELALLSFFGEDMAEALKPFTVLRTNAAPGAKPYDAFSLSGAGKAQVRVDSPEMAYAFGSRFEARWGDRVELRWTARNTYASALYLPGTISAAWYSRRIPLKLLAGDFSARLGQGLLQWSGLTLNSTALPSSLVRNPSGIGATSSISPDLTGLAGELGMGRWRLSAGLSIRGMSGNFPMPLLALNWTGDRSSLGLNATGHGASFSWKTALFGEGISFFGELAWRGGPAALAGLMWVPSYGSRLALRGRWFSPLYSKDYSGVSAAWACSWLSAGLDCGWKPSSSGVMASYKTLIRAAPEYRMGSLIVRPALRGELRWRPGEALPLRSGLRPELAMEYGGAALNLRYDRLWCRGAAWLFYAEPGFRAASFSVWARWSLFCVDSWDDRIYVYEKDIPWAFSVPAYYGRGYALSLVAAWKASRRFKLNLRCAFTDYPWNLSPKASRFESHIQLSFNI